jgi:uncharacterized protein (UPF0276 family)
MTIQGAGFSLRSQYFSDFINQQQPIDWLEILADQLIGTQGILLEKVKSIAANYPTTLHAVSLNIAGTDPLDQTYLKQIKALTDTLKPTYVSDHCCWVAQGQRYAHDLLPFAYDESSVTYIASRISAIQDILKKPLLLENLSHYIAFEHACSEAEFLNTLCDQTGCGILLDINNVYVSSQNQDYDPFAWLKQLNPQYIKQCHLAGHIETNQRLIDTHSKPVPKPVWELYRHAISLFGAVPTCLEWDNNLPSWNICLSEINKINTALTHTKKKINTLKYQTSQTKPSLKPPIILKNFQKKTLDTLLKKQSLDDENGWSVHQNSSRIQRIKSIDQVFGNLKHILGEPYWQQLCLKYILSHPSTSADITAEFDQFITLLKQEIGEDNHPVIDFARYLWCWYQSFHNSSLIESSMESLQQALSIHAEDTIFSLSPCIRLLTCDYPVATLWAACQPEYSGPTPVEIVQELDNETVYMLFYQHQQRVHVITLDQTSFNGLQLLNNPITLNSWAENAEKLDQLDPNAFAQWYAKGWLNIKEYT